MTMLLNPHTLCRAATFVLITVIRNVKGGSELKALLTSAARKTNLQLMT